MAHESTVSPSFWTGVCEVVGQQELAQRVQLMQAVGKLPRRRLPGTCRAAAARKGMPVFPSPLSGFGFHSIKRPYADLDLCLGVELSPSKLLKLKTGLSCKSAGRPVLATVNPRSSCKKPRSPSGIVARTDKVGGDSERGSSRYGKNEWTGSTGDEEAVPETASSEHGTNKWKLRVVASSRFQSPSLLASDVIGTIDFNEDGNFFATGGIARKIRICSYLDMIRQDELRSSYDVSASVDDEDDDDDMREMERRKIRRRASDSNCEFAATSEILTPGKLSSLKWRPGGSEVIGCGDYDGVVTEWSIEHGHAVSERYDHSGQRVWSLDYSKVAPTLSASSSADGTVRVWNRGVEKSVVVLRPPSRNSVCSAEFSPVAQHLISVGSADTHVYLYDLRRPESALIKARGHKRAVSYVRFLSQDIVVSASIDSTLKLWDISAPSREVDDVDQPRNVETGVSDHDAHLVRTFSSHTNVRHFVGLSVHKGGSYLACGSETDQVFVYSSSSSVPLLQHNFPSRNYGNDFGDTDNSYVGAVCWREQGDNHSLVVANSKGLVQVLQASI